MLRSTYRRCDFSVGNVGLSPIIQLARSGQRADGFQCRRLHARRAQCVVDRRARPRSGRSCPRSPCPCPRAIRPRWRICCAVGIDVEPMIWPFTWPSWPRTLRLLAAEATAATAAAALRLVQAEPATEIGELGVGVGDRLLRRWPARSTPTSAAPPPRSAASRAWSPLPPRCWPRAACRAGCSAVSCHVLRSASVIGMSLSPVTRTVLVATSLPSTTSVTR